VTSLDLPTRRELPAAPAGREGIDPLPAVVGATVCLLPFLDPAGPGNTAPADVAMVAAIVVALLHATREHVRIRFPYLAGVTGLVVGGAVAALAARAPASVGLVLVQDLLLLVWAATIALGGRSHMIVVAVTRAWCRTAPVYSAVVVCAYVVGFAPLSGVSAKDGVRAAYTFGDPNLAGNYLVVSLFVMAACERPRSAGVRRAAYAVVLLAIAFTGSNGAMLTVVLGLVCSLSLTALRRRGPIAGLLALTASLLAACLLVLVVLPRVDVDGLRERAAGSVPLLRDSFGRSAGSSDERSVILAEGTELYLHGDALGYGPSRTKATLQATQAPYVKEAHNDYLATLLERGLIGAVGLLMLGVAVAWRCGRLCLTPLPPKYAEIVPRAWLLVTIAPVMAVSASFYEVLHFRHLWTWLGLVAALVLALQHDSESEA
jgi:O-antigen ligase